MSGKPLVESRKHIEFDARVKYFKDLFAGKERAIAVQRTKTQDKHPPKESGQKLGEKKPKPEIPSFRIG
jgi:hypothetical protein